MLDWTDRHCRYFHRLLTRRTCLYTEMVVTKAVLHGPRERLLAYDPAEHPVALQLGGAEAAELAECARIAEALGYDEVNLNCGCPSDRVQSARFGACLMAEPETVARAVAAMRAAVGIPVTVKCRIGIDDRDDYADLRHFVDAVAAAGADTFIVHARKAWLQGLSPKENREIPPLRYDVAARLKAERPALTVVLNGGIRSLAEAEAALAGFDGAMLGRAAYQDPWLLAEADRRLFGEPGPATDRHGVVEAMVAYAEREIAAGARLYQIARHMLGLFNGMPGARAWRRHIAEQATRPDAPASVLAEAASLVRPEPLGIAA